jgi:hypothetical protein
MMTKQLKTIELPKPLHPDFSRYLRLFAVLVAAASLTLLSSPRAAAQDPSDSSQQPQADSQSAPQDQRPIISKDTIPQDNQDQQGQQDQDQAPPPRRQRLPNRMRPVAQPSGPIPANITIPAGKVIFARLNEPLSSDHNHPGDTFTATLDQPIVVDGWVVARRGETIVGTVTQAQKAGRVKGVSHLGVELTDITVVDGNQMPVKTELWTGSAGTSHGADAGAIATTTGAGAIIGAAANGGTGAGVGAGAGALAGIGLVLLTRGKPTVLGPEYPLSFRLKEPLTISTVNSAQAFLPAGQDDYNSSPSLRRRGGPGYPVAYSPYYASCGPYYGCGPYYPYYGYYGPAFGFYGGYWGGYGRGFGHGFGHGGFRR